MIGNSIIMELIANCVLWHYESYDHKAAMAEFGNPYHPKADKVWLNNSLPDELKEKHAHRKVGKLRTMKFDPDGMISKMYVGRSFKYAKRFFPQDVGVSIKPILNPNDDKFNLISAGLAVDENLIN